MGKMHIMDQVKGDEHIEWDPNDENSVRRANRAFNKFKKQGFLAYKLIEQTVTKRGEELKKFDRHAGKIVMCPPMAGGAC